MEPYPLTFEPILVEKVWGGRTLEKFGKNLPVKTLIGESWELADLPQSIPKGQSIISNGPLAGQQLNRNFPLLIKFLDACDNLSVQVHPSIEYAATHPKSHLKSEAWIILETTPEGLIYVGLKEGTTEESLRASIQTNTVPELLNAMRVKKGECYYLPSGTCHALGAGVLVAEVQTPSDTTFRVWDWGRKGRTMHVDQAMECIDFNSTPEKAPTPVPLQCGPFETTLLVETPYFSAERITALNDASMELVVDESPAVLMVIAGHATIDHTQAVDAPVGTTVLLPVGLQNASLLLTEGTSVLRFDIPSQTIIASA